MITTGTWSASVWNRQIRVPYENRSDYDLMEEKQRRDSLTPLGTGKHFPPSIYLGLLIVLNAIPLYGVFMLDWSAFDLIFLYWIENWIIGGFMLLRMMTRPFKHPVEIGLVFFLVPFFSFHYGMFCTVHGVFVFALFGQDAGINDNAVIESVVKLMLADHIFFSIVALTLWQFVDWVRDLIEKGAGAEGLKEVTAGPYQRIAVLHVTLIFSGFLIMSLEEPTAGLALLVLIKTGFDIFNWRREERKIDSDITPDDAVMADFNKLFLRPKLDMGSWNVEFDSFAELKASKEYKRYLAFKRFKEGHKFARQIDTYLDYRAAEENG